MSEYTDDEYVIRGARSFGAAVKEFRHRAGLSQAELAQQAELHRSYLSSLENGLATEAMRNFMSAVRALGLEVVVRPKVRGGD